MGLHWLIEKKRHSRKHYKVVISGCTNVKNYEGLETYLHASFKDIARRYEIPGSETEDFITYYTAVNMSFMFKSGTLATPTPLPSR